MRAYNSWVLWRYEDIGSSKPTKVPYSINGQLGNVNDPTTWSTFDQTMAALYDSHSNSDKVPYSGIGFVFSDRDPYSFIDLDESTDPAVTDRQLKVSREFDSYSEISPSGKGLHVIVKGSVPQGRRRSSIEIYSSQRYATMTGNVYNSSPIKNYQDLITQLWEQMGSGPANYIYGGDTAQTAEDIEIVKLASRASNGEKFSQLLNGNWSDIYPSQSEADLAFIDIVAFYTQNKEQIIRIFRQSPLGARPKAKRNDYINWMISKSFDKMLPPIDIEGFSIANEQINSSRKSNTIDRSVGSTVLDNNELKPVSQTVKAVDFDSTIKGSTPLPAAKLKKQKEPQLPFSENAEFKLVPPPGLVGDIARFVYDASPRQVPETAIAAALGLMAGICGKAYNISGTGLNQYIILVGNTGVGKESMASGIDKLMKSIKFTVPTSINFIGPAHISSGQALVRYINQNPCFVSIIGEFAFRLQSICDAHASGSEKVLYQVLLDLYNKSGFHQDFRPSIYADKEKNVTTTHAPSFSILAESTPETFYGILNEDMISTGLMPRFTIIECKSQVPYLNKNAANIEPPLYLADQFSSLVAQCEQITHAKRVINIESNEGAHKLLNEFEKFATDKTNATEVNFLRHLWNRAHLKALKISALIAVGINPIEPMVTTEHVDKDGVIHNPVQWAIDLVVNDIRVLSSRFEQGEVGSNTSELKQLQFTKRIVKEYLEIEWERAEKYKVMKFLFDDKVIPASYLSRRLAGQHSFRMDRQGSTLAIKRCLQFLMDADIIREIPKLQMLQKYGTGQKAYVISNIKGLGD